MGCAGSKPHHLLSSSIKDHHHHHHHHHVNSPQKGFILFNAKTIEYLKANEPDIKIKLVQRCEQKLLKTMSQSTSKSLLSNAKRTLLPSSSNNASFLDDSKCHQNENTNNTNKNSNSTLPNSISSPSASNELKQKEISIDSAVDYVLKYAINDFDIENFKSSNHLSMKQIRKDIMKKNQQSRTSLSRLNTSISTNNANNLSNNNNTNTKTLTLNSKEANKYLSSTFYKSALNTAIDEFGLFIQENFIVINEFDAKKLETSTKDEKSQDKVDSKVEKEDVNSEQTKSEESIESEPSSSATSEDDAMKLKEALELARQNFYKGKVSMVCLNKKGGYVVKEVTDQTNESQVKTSESDDLVVVKSWTSDSVNKNETMTESADIQNDISKQQQTITPRINIEDVDTTLKSKETKSVSNASVKSFNLDESNKETDNKNKFVIEKSGNDAINEFMSIKNDLAQLLNDTIELIVRYSTKSANENSNSIDVYLEKILESSSILEIENILLDIQKSGIENDSMIDLLKENLEKSKNVIEILRLIEEKDFDLVDEKLVQSTLNLDYVNKEFKTYLSILENSLEQQLDKLNKKFNELTSSKGEANLEHLIRVKDENMLKSLNKNKEIRVYVEQIDSLISNLSKKLFSSKGLPHPNDADLSSNSETPAETTVDVLPQGSVEIKEKKIDLTEDKKPSESLETNQAVKTDECKNVIDIKKEIAFSILNMGEVLAKTIDYYSLDSKNSENELKELIEISEKQAVGEKVQETMKKVDSKEMKEETDSKLLHVNTEVANSKSEEESDKTQKSQGSLASSLSSPSFSSSSSISPSGSLSPVPQQQQQQQLQSNENQSNDQLNYSSSRQEYEIIEKVKSTALSNQVEHQTNTPLRTESIKEDIAYLVEEMSVNMNTQLNILDEYERYQAKANAQAAGELSNTRDSKYEVIQHLVHNGMIEGKMDSNPKSSSSSSDILSSNNDENDQNQNDESNMLVQQFISNIIETASQKYHENDQQVNFRNGVNKSEPVQKRMSLDEELLYQLEEVDKKVKYMNETCSENEGDDDENDLDDENFDFDESVEMENTNDERLFHPRRPAKIKSELRQNRAIDLHEEIKQISNVIQDLVQTINVRNGSNNGSANGLDIEQTTQKQNTISSCDDNNADSEDYSSNENKNYKPRVSQLSKLNSNVDRKSLPSRKSLGNNSTTASSNIPVRQKILTKQKATSIEDELAESFKTAPSQSTVFESFFDFGSPVPETETLTNPSTPEINMNKNQANLKTTSSSSSSQRFKSRLPVKK